MKIVRAKKGLLATLMALLIVLGEGCVATSATIKSNSASTVESRIKSNSASAMENRINSDSANTVENRIKTALTEKTTDLFVIGSEFVFEPGAKASHDKEINGEIVHTVDPTLTAQSGLKDRSSGFIIRIDEGQISMEDSNNYKCTLEPLPNNQGVSLTITQKNDENTISGIIKGNTLTASQSVDWFSPDPVSKQGYGCTYSGKYSVNMLELGKSKWPPLPVTLSVSTNFDNNNRILTWEDKNPAGIVKCYDIYRTLDPINKATKVATVSNCSTWTDTSPEVKSEYDVVNAFYYIVSINAAGVESPESNEELSEYCFH